MNHIDTATETYASEIVEGILGVLPMIHKKLLQAVDIRDSLDLTRYHYAILGILSRSGPLPISAVGNKLLISKPQMTAIISRLVDLEMVARETGSADRRIINISITQKGRDVLARAVKQIKKGVASRISALSERDRALLSESLKNLARIGSVL